MGDHKLPAIDRFETLEGAVIFRIPLEVFPGFLAFVYLILADSLRILVDVGSGLGNSNKHLEEGLQLVRDQFGSFINFAELTHVLITHSHIDHFGGLTFVRPQTAAKIGIHELDFRNVTNYEERVILITRRLGNFLLEAGVTGAQQTQLLDLYKINKRLFHSTPVDFTFEAAGMSLGPIQMLHVPGHCAGQTVFRLHNVLIIGDHVLSKTTPHMAPETLTLNTGLGHYLQSLADLENWISGVTLTLPAHEDPIENLPSRIAAIRAHHSDRLEKTLEILERPKTIAEVSNGLFGWPNGYDALLAVEEAGAHIEYLHQRGQIRISNLEELDDQTTNVPIKYVRF